MKILLLTICLVMTTTAWCQSRLSIPVLDSLGKKSKIDARRYPDYKFLLVNVDPADSSYNQFGDLVTLSSRISKCIIIILPINCAKLTTDELAKFFSPSFRSINLLIAEPVGEQQKQESSVNKWLAVRSNNGHVNFDFSSPMQKVLIGRSGELEGIFGARMKPLDNHLVNAISK